MKKKTGWQHSIKKGGKKTKTGQKTKKPQKKPAPMDNLTYLWDKFQKKHQKLRTLNQTPSFEAEYLKRKERLEDETRILRTNIYNHSHKLIKKPADLKKSQTAGTMKILLDANAVLHILSSYELLNGIKTMCPPENLAVYVPKFVKDEIKHKRVRKELSYGNIISELNGIFKHNIKDIKFNLKTEDQKTDIQNRYSDLSQADAKCLLYAKYEDAILITNDGKLKDACEAEFVQIIDQYDRQRFTQTTDSNLEDWLVGKIQRMKTYWSELQELKKSNTAYLEKRDDFKALFQSMIRENMLVQFFFIKVYLDDGDSLPKKTESFFDLLPEKPDMTLTDIDITMKKIPN